MTKRFKIGVKIFLKKILPNKFLSNFYVKESLGLTNKYVAFFEELNPKAQQKGWVFEKKTPKRNKYVTFSGKKFRSATNMMREIFKGYELSTAGWA